MAKLRVLDLFAGIAGFSLGLERTGGFETVGFCELKPHARRVLAKNFPGVPCHDDVTTYDFKPGEADVITAGFPCQDISFAGDGAGLSGARSGLYREVIRAIRMVRPQYAILENVAALLSRGLGVVLRDLAEIGNDAEWHCIPASAVGAPHRRDRIWIVANPGSDEHEGYRAPFSGSLAKGLSETIIPDAMHDGAGWRFELPESSESQGLVAYPESDGQSISWAWNQGCHDNTEGTDAFRIELGRDRAGARASDLADADSSRLPVAWDTGGQGEAPSCLETGRAAHGAGWWATEPELGRVAHGVSNRVDRLGELGNAVVPQIPELIGHAILQARPA